MVRNISSESAAGCENAKPIAAPSNGAVQDVQSTKPIRVSSLSITLDRPYEVGDWLKFDDIDGVVITVGDRWNGIMAAMAAEAGKDIYCEKPVSHSVVEARAMAAATDRTTLRFHRLIAFQFPCDALRSFPREWDSRLLRSVPASAGTSRLRVWPSPWPIRLQMFS